MSEEEGEIIKTSLQVALYRIALGIIFGAFLISLLFTVWALTIYGVGPNIGILIFNFIGLFAICFIVINKIF
jgi:hypothetical protein